ncbi:DUF805 domain-containing protein [uncultured Amnibacterium sp.]|uniref:DUF805 domain-containing protein n=1 Tax=uncultured Amnibacterium sp. TaxID=1631851 RepID=UPI0035C9EF31
MTADPTEPDRPLSGASPLVAWSRFWRRSFVFSGRASLSEYWWPVLLNTGVAVVVAVIGGSLLGGGEALSDDDGVGAPVLVALGSVLLFAVLLLLLAQLVPSIAASVRRLHDANLSGLLYLLVLIPSVGGLILLVLHVLPSSPAGRRFDQGAPAWGAPVWGAPPAPGAQPAAVLPSLSNGGFDSWPAPATPAPPTAPLPVAMPTDPAQQPDDALVAAWREVGAVGRVEARLSAQPSWRQQGYLLIHRADGVQVLATNGLGGAEGAAALGPGAEVYVASRDLGSTDEEVAKGWRFTLVAAVARRIGASGMNLPAELEQYGALSMSVVADAPAEWRGADGAVGVLIGVGLPGVPEAVATAAGEIRLVGLVPLRPDELQRILVGGREVRGTIAGRLAALPPELLTAPDRPAV